ncbi:MAG: C4-dicarboxylate TRAP transporter large permease protein DctM [Dehalococcoidia bacterium]|nr:C4-dicarboxylate TRAP transporter large permease protein DctM [Bacillota bacterium]
MDFNPLWMLPPIFIGKALGYPIGFVLGGVALITGLIFFGEMTPLILAMRVFILQTSWELIAVPLFILMGCVLERSGAADKLYGAFHIWMGPLPGGLAAATVMVCTIMAAAIGVMGAPVVMMGLLALPQMLKRRYDVKLAAGSIMASGCLGIFIPPSVMLVIYGAWAGLSVGRLFMAAVFPGLVLSGLYIAYILIRAGLQPELGPALTEEERGMSFRQKLLLMLSGIIPTLLLIFIVMGTILLGIATPTEAGAMGCVGSLIVAAINRRLTWSVVKEATYQTARVLGMVAVIAAGSTAFIGVFMVLGGGRVISDMMLGLGLGGGGLLVVMMVLIFLMGMVVDWVAIIMIAVPLFTPIVAELGFDPIWFAVLVCMNLQMSFLTPPFGIAVFYMRGVAPPEVTTGHLLRSIIPFVLLIMIGLGLVVAFPWLALWLPAVMR